MLSAGDEGRGRDYDEHQFRETLHFDPSWGERLFPVFRRRTNNAIIPRTISAIGDWLPDTGEELEIRAPGTLQAQPPPVMRLNPPSLLSVMSGADVGTHLPLSQLKPEAQSVLAMHFILQDLPAGSQAYGLHLVTGVPGTQLPVASHRESGTCIAPLHEPALQTVMEGKNEQVVVVPLQVAQELPSPHLRAPAGAPAATGEQVPSLPATLHAAHESVQAVSQQTPSVQ